jgi:hypothetical protein
LYPPTEDEDQEIEEHDPRKREERGEVSSYCRTLYNSCTQMVGSGGREREGGGEDLDSLRKFLARAGRIPESDSDLSWWLGEVLPLTLPAKQRLLETKTTLARLTQLQIVLNPKQTAANTNCILM